MKIYKDINPSAYFLDLDGTFFDQPDANYPASDFNIAVAKKINSYKPVIVSTGRKNNKFLRELMAKINAPFTICSVGAQIIDNKGKTIWKATISPDDKQKIMSEFQKLGLFIFVNDTEYLYCSSNNNPLFIRSWASQIPRLNYDKIPYEDEVFKYLVFGLEKDEMVLQLEKWRSEYPSLSFHLVSKGYSIEITHKLATKGKAAQYICELLGLDIKTAMHIGDSGNDVTAKPEIGYLMAVANSMDEIKSIADFVSDHDYKNGGVGKIMSEIEHL
ncbi:HAD family hydrolase [Mycoplasma sp. ES3157-GEN-MYC]|uniref:HAD hydrolase family protein n=1 Tax=Mycoplasma miroungigenitalium TaxID=754515 RepID=A0A6M4J8R1_9MOLU|nr:HAD hydrolase family protein [Mycoplasma miroungigenitalium]MBU4690206.1 HAD family hydrolase [Mycoplasma miroungigenitalium]MBU4691475.1 HAD family hydrolase [Mycoplasma miroungigenitalium]QJR43310.1 HAD hydrolase family protein [Mycoplasma miroungigenitalium]